MTFHFPTDLEQNNFFKHVLNPMFIEYKMLKNSFKIIKNRNSTYPRLSDTQKRGKPAALELLSTILKNKNINQKMPFSILYQLDSTREIHENDGLYYIDADKDVFDFTYKKLSEGIEDYNNQIKEYMESDVIQKEERIEHLLSFMTSLELSPTEIMKIIHHLARI
tara:strand:+ start:2794 stop:3288 length:495 start_codon:yes stop_codon:yes gene_type:complete